MGKTTGPRRMKDSATTVVPNTMHNLIYKDKYQEMWSSLVEAVVAHWLKLWWLIGWRCSGSLVGDVVSHWWKM